MQKVLIAVRSEQFSKSLAERLEDRACVKCCTNTEDAMDLVVTENPDLLVIDLELPTKTGLYLVRMISESGRRIPSVALVGSLSEYVCQHLSQYGVEHIYLKPCCVEAISSNILELIKSKEQITCTFAESLADRLISLGFDSKASGFSCLVEAIRIFSEDMTQRFTKTVYPEVGKICNCTPECVERAIRCLIQRAWNRSNRAEWSLYFPEIRETQQAPSNGVFIYKIAECLASRKVC